MSRGIGVLLVRLALLRFLQSAGILASLYNY